LDNDIAVLKLFPGISKKITSAIINTPGIKAIILETFGRQCHTQEWFTNELKKAISKGIIILNITQCQEGKVIQGMYETSSHLKKIGVVAVAISLLKALLLSSCSCWANSFTEKDHSTATNQSQGRINPGFLK